MKIAMWSGPRNISTALMRSFENRTDTFVSDEPFYAYFLNKSGENHPARQEILNNQSSDWDTVSSMLIGEIPNQKKVWYQKHMAHHIFKHSDLSWTKRVVNLFLIRDPKEVIVSYQKRFNLVDHMQLGYNQQIQIIKTIADTTGDFPIVINAKDVLMHPEKILKKLCEIVQIDFEENMLSWPDGKRDTDGVWAPFWYSEVEKTTGFQPYVDKNIVLDSKWEDIYDRCMIDYKILKSHSIKAD
tara:strand:+ start:5063 stop:5788 length:726 start_codon:yes stop_codon:yes gene_type:complete